jgi:hypothetical protein
MIGNVGGAERDLADLFRCVRNLSLSLSLSLSLPYYYKFKPTR